MAETLHRNLLPINTELAQRPNELLEQINFEDEFAVEIALLKNQMMQPRDTAVTNLLNIIQESATAVQH
jgi:hypothetical protein